MPRTVNSTTSAQETLNALHTQYKEPFYHMPFNEANFAAHPRSRQILASQRYMHSFVKAGFLYVSDHYVLDTDQKVLVEPSPADPDKSIIHHQFYTGLYPDVDNIDRKKLGLKSGTLAFSIISDDAEQDNAAWLALEIMPNKLRYQVKTYGADYRLQHADHYHMEYPKFCIHTSYNKDARNLGVLTPERLTVYYEEMENPHVSVPFNTKGELDIKRCEVFKKAEDGNDVYNSYLSNGAMSVLNANHHNKKSVWKTFKRNLMSSSLAIHNSEQEAVSNVWETMTKRWIGPGAF